MKKILRLLPYIILYITIFVHCNRQIVEELKKELYHIETDLPVGYEKLILDESIISNGDFVMESLPYDKIPAFVEKHNIKSLSNIIAAASFSESIHINTGSFTKSFTTATLKSILLVVRKSKTEGQLDILFLFVNTQGLLADKTTEMQGSTICDYILGYEICREVQSKNTSYNIEQTTSMELALKHYSFEYLKQKLSNYILQIFIFTESEFNILDVLNDDELYKGLEKNGKNNKNKWMKNENFLSYLDLHSNFEALQGYLRTISDNWSQYLNKFTPKYEEYADRVFKSTFNTLDRSTKLQMITGISEENYDEYIEGLKYKMQLPHDKIEEFSLILEGIKLMDSHQWNCIDFLFSVNNKEDVKYVSLLSNKNTDNTYSFIVADILATFTLAPQLIVIRNTNNIFNGFFVEVNEYMTQIPSNLNQNELNDVIYILKHLSLKAYSKHFNIGIDLNIK